MPNQSALFEPLERLEQAGFFFTLKRGRDGFVMVDVAVSGERWEIELSTEGQIEAEVFAVTDRSWD